MIIDRYRYRYVLKFSKSKINHHNLIFRNGENIVFVMMPRMSRRVDDVQKEFAEDFTVVNDNLLLCKVKYVV